MSELVFTPATELAARIRRRDLSPVDVVDAVLDRIDEVNPRINAFVTLLDDEAREAAREAERAVESGAELGPLHGVPVGVKDLYAFKRGVPNTFGSVPFADYIPDRDAPLVARLEAAGAIVVGKTNTPEFGHKGETVNDVAGRTANPFDTDVTPGGSSGGSAAAVASGMLPIAQGSDHAGSIRSPASRCNLYGHFPSAGRVPHAFHPDAFKYHLPYAGSGPLTRTVEDAALMLDVIAGPHPHDPDSLQASEGSFVEATRRSIRGLTVGYVPTLRETPIDPAVAELVEDSLDGFRDAGAEVERVSIEFDRWEALHDALVIGLVVVFAETAEQLEAETGIDLLEHRDTVAETVAARIETGRGVSAMEYRRANVVRTAFYNRLADLFSKIDLLVTPTSAVPPYRDVDGSGPPEEVDGKPVPEGHGTMLTWPFNLTGNPVASVPAGLTDAGLPVGAQVIAPRFRDDLVFAAGAAIERTRPWADAYPP